MRPTLVVGNGPALFVTGPESARAAGPFLLDSDPRRAAARFETLGPSDVPDPLLSAIASVPPGSRLLASPPRLARALSDAARRPIESPTVEELRRARSAIPDVDPEIERRFFLALGHLRLERALRAPEEVLITLAREEERVERAVGREARAAESFIPCTGFAPRPPPRRLGRARGALGDLEVALRDTLEEEARRLVPNLSAVVGPRTAARLVALAGGVGALARMPSARIQLLGSSASPVARARSPIRNPVPSGPTGRCPDRPTLGCTPGTLAALAAIAVRADASTHRDISAELVARRDRRVEALRRTRR